MPPKGLSPVGSDGFTARVEAAPFQSETHPSGLAFSSILRDLVQGQIQGKGCPAIPRGQLALLRAARSRSTPALLHSAVDGAGISRVALQPDGERAAGCPSWCRR